MNETWKPPFGLLQDYTAKKTHQGPSNSVLWMLTLPLTMEPWVSQRGVWSLPWAADHPTSLNECLVDLWPKGGTRAMRDCLPRELLEYSMLICVPHLAWDLRAQFFPCKNLSPSLLEPTFPPQWPTFPFIGSHHISVLPGNILHSHSQTLLWRGLRNKMEGDHTGYEHFLKGWWAPKRFCCSSAGLEQKAAHLTCACSQRS